MQFPDLASRNYWTLTTEEQRAVILDDFWDVGISVNDIYNGTY